MLNLRSPREIAQMRRAGLLVWQAHQAVAERIRPGVTTGELDEAVEEVFAAAREPIPLFQGSSREGPLPCRHLHLGQ